VFSNLVTKCVLQCRLVNEYQHIKPPSRARPVHLKLVLYVDFHTTHGTRSIKIVNGSSVATLASALFLAC